MADALTQSVTTQQAPEAGMATQAYAAQRQPRVRARQAPMTRAVESAATRLEATSTATATAAARPASRPLRTVQAAGDPTQVLRLEAAAQRPETMPTAVATPPRAVSEARRELRVPIGSKGVRVENDGSVYAQFEDRDRLIGQIEIRERPRYQDERRAEARRADAAATRDRRLAVARQDKGVVTRPDPAVRAAQTIRGMADALGVQTQVQQVRSQRDLAGALVNMAR